MTIKTSGRFTATIQVPFTGLGAVIADGALVMAGVTAETDLGLAIPVPAGNAGVDTIGILKGASVVANDSVPAGTTYNFKEVELIDSTELLEFEYGMASGDVLAVTSTSTTTVTITSLEDNIDNSWLYAVSGTGAGLLAFVVTSASGSCVTKTATGWDSTTKVIKILRFGHKVVALNAASQIDSNAAAGTFTCFIFENYIDAPAAGISKQLLDPTKHDNINLGTLIKPRFTTRLAIRANAGR